ncbi:MAG TPA: hypothetical protein PKZ54_09000 [Syntrophorhabdaceae bacterium]|nr:hypothetical protein [Syntrophorhabdaceae bacterium]
MPSNTKKTRLRRKIRKSNQGRKRKKLMSRMSTSSFSVHPEKNE